MSQQRLEVDWARCVGHLVCVDLLPELITVDDWGYPMLPERPIPRHLMRHARRAKATCPALALRLRLMHGAPRHKAIAAGSG
ncbi:MAG: ferredoxin [Actinobacteria bacterium]|nr:ferredoxin [Actinomycetota bacterium]